MAILIKNFGNDTICNSVDELRKALLTKYKDTSVTIVSTSLSGIQQQNYVDVQSDGSLLGSYSSQPLLLSCFNF